MNADMNALDLEACFVDGHEEVEALDSECTKEETRFALACVFSDVLQESGFNRASRGTYYDEARDNVILEYPFLRIGSFFLRNAAGKTDENGMKRKC